MASFPSIEEYGAGPSEDELNAMFAGRTSIEESEFNDPNSETDNRDAVRMFLKLQGVPKETFDALIEPYDLGFYKKSDGKSTPISFLRVPQFLKKWGFKKDIVSVRHDLDYYRGQPRRNTADKNYLVRQKEVGEKKWVAAMEWFALWLFGKFSWKSHKKKRQTITDYGTNEYIPNLPNIEF
jgi:hypothetical protein